MLGDDRGAIAAIVGLAIIPLFAAIGLAVDSARGYMLKSKLSYAIDAAGLAGGRAFETDMREEDIMMFFEANFPPGYMGSVLAPGHPDITFDDEENTVTIVASATIPTAFMGVAGVDEMTVSARTVIKRELRGMELVLVMDNTGSMRDNGGMAAMKPAATALVDILYGDRERCPGSGSASCPTPRTSTSAPSTRTGWSRRPTTRMRRGRTPIPPARPASATMRITTSPRPGRAASRRARARATATTIRPTSSAGIPISGGPCCGGSRTRNGRTLEPST